MFKINHSVLAIVFSLMFTACEVGITPLEQQFNEAGVATSGVVSEDGDIGTITVEVQEGVEMDDLNVSVEIFGDGSEHFTVTMDKTASAYIGDIKVKEPKPVFYYDTPFTFSARTIVNGQKMCAKKVQKTVPKTEVAPEAFDVNVTLDLNDDGVFNTNDDNFIYRIIFDLNATDKNGDALTYAMSSQDSNLKYGTLSFDGKKVTYTIKNDFNSKNSDNLTDIFTYIAKHRGSRSNEATVTITIIQKKSDNVVPVITLNGQNPVNLTVDHSYTDAGATASDNVDGNITARIVLGGDKLDTSTVGTYTVTYDVNDSAGNSAIQVTRTVNVKSGEVDFNATQINKSKLGTITELELADIDDDNDLDIFALYTLGGKGKIQVYKNKGDGKYTTIYNIKDYNITTMHTADLDGDGEAELLFGSENPTEASKNTLYLYKYSEQDIIHLDDVDSRTNITAIKTGYIDKDNKIDIIFTTSAGSLQYFNGVNISTILSDTSQAGSPTPAYSLVVGDNKKIFVAGEYGESISRVKINYLGGSIGSSFFSIETINKTIKSLSLADLYFKESTQSLIMTGITGLYVYSTVAVADKIRNIDVDIQAPTHATGADINGDGKIDILSSTGSTVVWYKNEEKGKFSKANHISDLGENTITKAGDMDNDGDMDVVVGDADGNITVLTNKTPVKVNKIVSVGDRKDDFTKREGTPYKAINTGTVTDSKTGLTWQSSYYNNGTNDYTWKEAKEFCANPGEYIIGTGWRLPSVEELMTIVYKGAADKSKSTIQANTNFLVTHEEYWTSTEDKSNTGKAWIIDFHTGKASIEDITETHPLRCVRGPKLKKPKLTRSNINVVTDTQYGLEWDDEIGEGNYTDASEACKERTNPDGWRLPTINELFFLADRTLEGSKLPKPFTIEPDKKYWSSTKHYFQFPVDRYYILDFLDGTDSLIENNTTNISYRCVRDINSSIP